MNEIIVNLQAELNYGDIYNDERFFNYYTPSAHLTLATEINFYNYQMIMDQLYNCIKYEQD